MPITLAIVALTPDEKNGFINVLKNRAADLNTAWTLFWGEDEFPEKVDAVFYCPKREESKKLASKLIFNGALPIAIILPNDLAASEVPLFIRLPFTPDNVIETLNATARRILSVVINDDPVDFDPDEEIDDAFSLPVALHKVFRSGTIKSNFVKIKKEDNTREILCWQDIDKYFAIESENFLSTDNEGIYEIYPAPNGKEILSRYMDKTKNASSLLWLAGRNGFSQNILFPGLNWDMKLDLISWPEIPSQFQNEQTVRIIRELTFNTFSMKDIYSIFHLNKNELINLFNSLVVSGVIQKASNNRFKNMNKSSVEEIIFLKALSNKIFNLLEES